MNIDDILRECVARRKLAPGKTSEQIVNEVVDEVNSYKVALAARPEFAPLPPADLPPVEEEEAE